MWQPISRLQPTEDKRNAKTAAIWRVINAMKHINPEVTKVSKKHYDSIFREDK
jgi:hypothetical protein